MECDTADEVDHEGESSGAVWKYLTEGAKCHHFTQKEGHCEASLLSRSSRHEEGQTCNGQEEDKSYQVIIVFYCELQMRYQ